MFRKVFEQSDEEQGENTRENGDCFKIMAVQQQSCQKMQEKYGRRRIFSHGSSMEKTNVASNHIFRRQKNSPTRDLGRG
jgi:hypothetical protein